MLLNIALAASSLLLPGLGQLLRRRIGWAIVCIVAALLWWFVPEITRSLSLAMIGGHKDPAPVLLRWQAFYDKSSGLLWVVRAAVHVASAYDAGQFPNGSVAQRVIAQAIGLGVAACILVPATITA
jgi:hypothetical protein